MTDDEEEWDCPLCMEEMDISDRNFKPCPCGYQICRFCWNHIKENLNAKCPACRRDYSDQTVEFTPLTPAELQRLRTEKKTKEREKREMEANNRRHLANMRVVQKNLVYIIGLSNRLANEEILRQNDYFGQYGKIIKIVINRKHMGGYSGGGGKNDPTVGIYVTFYRKEDAARCIHAIDGTVLDGRVLRASYGTTKYCSFFLRGLQCQNPGCMYLHEPGDDADSYTKEEMALGKHHAKIHPTGTYSAPSTNAMVNENGIAVGPAAPLGAAYVASSSSSSSSAAASPQQDDGSINQLQRSPLQVIASTSLDEDSPALPRSAAWASGGKSQTTPSTGPWAKQQRSAEDGGAVGLIECNLFDDISPWCTYDSIRSDPEPSINTAMLHRYFYLARQCREYFIQLTSQLYVQGQQQQQPSSASTASPLPHPTQAAFQFDPFQQEEAAEKSAAVLSEKSRFGFAHVNNELADRFDKAASIHGGGAVIGGQMQQMYR